MANQLGMNAKLYYKVGGQGGGGSWVELTNCRDVTLSLDMATADTTVRGNGGWRSKAGALREAKVEWEMVFDTADAGLTAISDAYLGTTTAAKMIGLQCLTDTVANSGEGLQADFNITGFERTEPLEDAVKYKVTAEVTYSSTAPSWL